MLHLIRRRSHYIAKTPADVMRSLTAGLSSGTFAVSYSWGHWTKTVARNAFKCFANGVCWIDIRNILPGHRIQDTCAEAMANADAAIVFLSDQYLRSQNCCIELLNLEPQCARVLAAMRNNWIDDLQDAESNGGTGTMPDGGRRPRVAGTQRNTTEFDTYTLSQLLQREPGRASRLVVIVSLNAFDNQRELRTELVSILSNAGHYVWFARPSTEIQLRRRLPRLVLEGFLRINTFQDIYKRQQTTPAVNDYWHGTAASMFKTANLHIATPLLALLMWVVDGVFFVVANLQDDTTDTNLTSSGIELLIDIVAAALIIVALAVHIALVVAMRGSYSHKHMRWLWIINPLIGIEYLLSYISPPIAQSIDFASLPDAGYLLAIVVRLRIGKRLRVCAKGIAKMPQLVKGALRTLIQYGVIQMTDTQDQADFSLVCLDVDDGVTVRKPRLGFGSTGGVKLCVPENLDTSGATLYWTRFTLEDIVKVAPDAKTAMIKCSSNKQLTSAQACPGLETIFVQMLKRSLGLTLTAHVAAGRGNFEDIDFEDVQQSSFLSKLFA
ncbi:hypothetical protein PTSG_10286 [Salpingoeca rosetta]|uniref:TIR domain-containing protein n=1 Tax=Salpingoeca rosetta (strain ATCC 50818 / BSB-021) TaxID=946362 RepID=F2UQV6_SALR5|nr:uncharacterized protein PTSG_10286 [Salpingoeca rosetta]EGD80011.1 hypothetical protein PTSG_10286 [Salpingoeca rosetta]|eukprot:XP_004988336.1 hypothetical protein PTSG_10286 [Salpingoeca rosetta]